MHILIAEIGTLAVAVLSGGYFFRDRLEQWPALQLVAGGIIMVATLVTLFECYGSAAKNMRELSEQIHQRAELEKAKATQAEEQAINRELQAELARLVCYRGALDGVWGAASRQALTDFLQAIGADNDYGTTIKVVDLRRMFRAAPDQVCSPRNPVNQAAALKRYTAAHNEYIRKCVQYFLAIPIETQSEDCRTLKNVREQLRARLPARVMLQPS